MSLLPSPDTLSFYLPGLVHQFGNLLLTVQGQVVHVETENIERMQDSVLSAVRRGGASLQVMRVLLGEQIGTTGSAFDLLSNITDLGRVPARECGVTIESRGKQQEPAMCVRAEPFVVAVAETLRRWIKAMRAAQAEVATITLESDGAGHVRVQFGHEALAGSLPFPMPAAAVAKAVSSLVQGNGASVTTLAAGAGGAGGVELVFPAWQEAPDGNS